MSEKQLKVVWICHFSDAKTRAHIISSRYYYKRIFQKFFRNKACQWLDVAVWVTNAISEFEKFEDINLTIIFPHKAIKGKQQSFSINGINYICFRSEDDNFLSFLKRRIIKKEKKKYSKNRNTIKENISKISPNVIHIIGAENPHYSISALDIPSNIPCVVSLQTLMSDPEFYNNYPISRYEYEYRSFLESEIIRRCDYIASPSLRFKEIVLKNIKPGAVFLNMDLALGQNTDLTPVKKEYDFVYFAANISKAADYAIEAFALAAAKKTSIKLNISGAYTPEYKESIDRRLEILGINENVYFTGVQPTHDDVLHQIKKSKYALLPLKVDQISGTIREAMACGLPVVTTITPATPNLNEKRESVLLSEKGDFQSMANNMLRLLNDEELSNRLKNNGIITVQETFDNSVSMNLWHKGYYAIVANFVDGLPIPEELLLK